MNIFLWRPEFVRALDRLGLKLAARAAIMHYSTARFRTILYNCETRCLATVVFFLYKVARQKRSKKGLCHASRVGDLTGKPDRLVISSREVGGGASLFLDCDRV